MKELLNLKLKTFVLLIIFSLVFVFVNSTNAAIRDTLSYQAKITDVNLLAPVDANYNMEFRVYDAVSGGNLLWTETWNGGNPVALEDGVFTVELNSICASWTGACASNGGIDWSSDSLFLEMHFDADGNGSFEETFAPRKRFTSVPYAQMAARLTTAEDINFSDNVDHSLQWNQATDKTLTIENDDATAVANLSVEGQSQVGNFASAPTALGNGSMYYNTTSNIFYVYQNSAWVAVGSGGGGGNAIWDADTDTGVQTEEGADEDIIRFDIGDASGTAYPDILKIDGINGLIWNDVGAALDFRIEGDTDSNLFFIDASADNVGIGLNNPNAKLEITSSDGNAIRVNPYGIGVGNTAEMQFMELVANGSDYVGFKSPDALAASVMWTLPNADGNNGEVLSTDSSGNLSWLAVGDGDAIWDGDTDTGVQMEETADEDIIRFDIGDASGTAYPDILKIDGTNGLIWNDVGAALDFRIAGDTNVNLLFVDASADNIGIGTNSPNFNLDIEEDAAVTDPMFRIYQTNAAGDATMQFARGGREFTMGIDQDDGDRFKIAYDTLLGNTNEWFTVERTGDIGIGTTNPGFKLEIEEAIDSSTAPLLYLDAQGLTADAALRFRNNGGNSMVMGIDGSDGNRFKISDAATLNATPRFVIETGGNVGINTNDPVARFEITSTNQNALRINPYNTGAGQTGRMQFMELATNGTNYVSFRAPDAIGSSVVLTLPTTNGSPNEFLMTDGSGVLSWENSMKSLWDGDTDTGIQVEQAADEDMIRFDIGDASGTAYPDVLKIDGTNGLVWNDAARDLDFRAEGDTDTNLFFVDASGDNIGIGEAAPDANAKLEVAGNFMLDDYVYFNNTTTEYLRHDGTTFVMSDDLLPSADDTLNLGSSTARWANMYLGPDTLYIGTDGNDYDISYDTANSALVFNNLGADLDFRLEGDTDTNLFFLDASTDNIGIGEAAPDINAKLEVAGNFMLDDYVYFNNATTDYLRHDGTTFVMSDDFLALTDDTYDFGSSTVRWNDQYLGGTLSFGANTDDYDIHFDETNNMLVLNDTGDADGLRIEGDAIVNLFYIDAVNDNIGIGLPDTPDHFDSRLTVRNGTSDAVMRLGGPEGTYHYGARLRFGDADYAYIDEYADDNLMVHADGNLYLDSTNGQVYIPSAYNNDLGNVRDLYVAADGEIGYRSSSIRYKENVLNMESIDWLYDLRPVNYAYKDKIKEIFNKETGLMEEVIIPSDKSKQYGLIAEEVDLINPSLVSYNEDGSIETVNYSILMTPLLKAVQDNKTAVDPILDRIKIADNGLEIERYNAADGTDALLIRNDGEGAGLHLVQTGNSNGLGHGAAIYISGNKNSSAGDDDGIADLNDSYGMYINSEESDPNQKILGIETDAGVNPDDESFYVRADGVTKVYAGAMAPIRNEDGEFGFAKAGNKGRLYFQVEGNDYYINNSGTGDFSEYIESSDQSLWEDWGTIVSLKVGGTEAKAKAMRSAEMRDKNVLGVVSEFGSRNNDNENGDRYADHNYVNVALMGQVPAKVTNQNGLIEAGDYLTTSLVYGHVMKADIGDPVIGIALETFYGNALSSEGMIDVLLSRNTNGNITALLKELQEKKTVTKADVLDVIMNENLVANYLLMTKGEVMDGLKVHGELELDNQNIGEVVLLAGETFVQINFPSYFKKKPVVTVSPYILEDHGIFFDFQYLLMNITAQSFVIRLNQPLSYDLNFNWQAFAIADYTDDFIVSETTTSIAEDQVIISSLNCSLDNLRGCLTAHDCWEYSELATWTGEACVLKESGF